MTIKVTRNDAGNCINFVGTSNPAYWNACLSAQVNTEDNTRVDVLTDIRSAVEGETVYEFYAVPYTEFAEADGTSFNDAVSAAAYITEQANVATNTGQFIMSATDTMDFSVDSTGTTILVGNGDSYAVNSIQAVLNDDGNININKQGTLTSLFADLRVANASIGGVGVSSDGATAVNELNSLFTQSGSVTFSAPTITSAVSYNINTGDSVNIVINTTGGIGFEYSSLPSGLAVNSLNRRNIVGSISVAGTYTFDVTVVNHYGSTTQTITLNVASSFSNTKSVSYGTSTYMGANAALLDGTLGRSTDGSGSGDAWTIALWVKPAAISGGQTLVYFGDNDTTNSGHLEFRITSTGKLRFRYGSDNNHIQRTSSNVVFTQNTWTHVVVTYDGSSTGASSGSLSSYYGSFELFVDGSSVTTSDVHNNYGYSGSVAGENLRLGRLVSGNYLSSGSKIEEVAVWNSDQTTNVSSIYNSGSPFDLSTLATSPTHWWRMGDGDTFPTITDNVGTAHFVMYNMTASDIVNDVP